MEPEALRWTVSPKQTATLVWTMILSVSLEIYALRTRQRKAKVAIPSSV